MNWIEIAGRIMINLDKIISIEDEDGSTRVYYSSMPSDSSLIPIQYETIKSLINYRESAREDSYRNIGLLLKGQFKPIP